MKWYPSQKDYLVNSTKTTFSELICFRKVLCCNSNGAEVKLQGFHASNLIHNFTRETGQHFMNGLN